MTNVKISTNKGDIVVALDEAKAPKTVANFLDYVGSGHYEGTIFHRVIANFMAQGGGFGTDFKQKATNAPVENEANNGLKNTKYTIAMARTSVPHSATSQFFINTADNDFLNHTSPTPQGWGYTVFGEVVEGREVVDAIGSVPTGFANGMQDVPNEQVVITKVEKL